MSLYKKNIQLGLCCLNTELRAQKPTVFASRSITLKGLKDKGIDELKRRILLNLEDVLKIIEWNEQNGIRVYRLSSEMFPHFTNSRIEPYSIDFAVESLKKIGLLAKKYGHRLTFHPGQFNILCSTNKQVVENTIKELDYHATVLDIMGMGKDSVMVIHGGGLYGDKKSAMQRWCDNYMKLPPKIKNRLVLENCERIFSIRDCLEISRKVGVPVVFDTHHYTCYNLLHPQEKFNDSPKEFIKEILSTWGDIKPKFHISEQGTGRCGHHSDFVETIPFYLLNIFYLYGVKIDIMIEAKKKEQAIHKLYKKYNFLDCRNTIEYKPKIKFNVIKK